MVIIDDASRDRRTLARRGDGVKRISEQVGKGLKQTDALEIFERQGLQESTGTPEELAALVAAEVSKWAKVIKAARIPLQ